MGQYFRPDRIEEAVAALANGGLTPLAGATDYFPAIGAAGGDVMDLSRLPG